MENSIVAALEKSSAMLKVYDALGGGNCPISVFGVSENAKCSFLLALYKHTQRNIIFVSKDEASALKYAKTGVYYPCESKELRRIEARSNEGAQKRIEILCGRKKGVISLSAEGFLSLLMPKSKLFENIFTLKKGESTEFASLAKRLVGAGYERADTVYAPGQFAKRGDVFDIFSPCAKKPYRISFFDDEIESIREFSCETQKSTGVQYERIKIYPAKEYLLGDEEKQKLYDYFAQFKDMKGELCAAAAEMSFAVEENGNFENADTFASLLYPRTTIADYFPEAIFVFDGFGDILAEEEKIKEKHMNFFDSGEYFGVQSDVYSSFEEILPAISKSAVDLTVIPSKKFGGVQSADLQIRSCIGFNGNMEMLAKSILERKKLKWDVILCAGAKAAHLSKILNDFDIIAPVCENEKGVICSQNLLDFGFEMPREKILVLGEGDIFGKIKRKVKRTKKSEKLAEDIFAELKAGDYVVHEVHGRGKYLGLKTMETAGTKGEYLEIEYKGGDKLYIPTWQIDRIQKYIGGEDTAVSLSKLGSKEWENAKKKAKASVKQLAFDLVALYAGRFENKGYAFSPDTVWQKQFEESFEFEETEGQIKSIREIKKDMEAPRSMDRLLLGDVGYGKTEVAMRACFKAVQDSKQVCMLVPTTLLARQHYDNFKKRFEGFPVTISLLSRYSKGKEIYKDIESGKTDIVIGTHKLLGKDVKFKNLGLLVVDEEQRFGVAHKEKIKLLKQNVDVLTLSATPIPRTLEMSLIGVRELSTIKTPPVDRKETYSYVIKYSEGLVKDAIRTEIGRGGQVYFVVRQVNQIEKLMEDISRLVPEAKIACAHGQMAEGEMDSVVSDFVDGKTDVLICTTIIESGIDIPAVNTIIVYEADKFGLSQLYQLKGRVGRSDKSSYAYFTFKNDKMGENSKKRLQAIKEFTQLGSGFKIAMRDLQIRGAGNLLGAEQSGHMASIGYSLYCKMMKQAVDEAKTGVSVSEEEFETAVDLGAPALIPDSYINEEVHKLDMYKAIGRIETLEDAKAVRLEIEDRYGKMPKETENLVVLSLVKQYAHRAGFAGVIKKGRQIVMKYSPNANIDIGKLLRFIEKSGEIASLRPGDVPGVVYCGKSVKGLIEFLNSLKHCKQAL